MSRRWRPGRDVLADRELPRFPAGTGPEVLELREELIWVDEQIAKVVARLAGAEALGRAAADLPDGTEVTLRFDDGTVVSLRVVASVSVLAPEAEYRRGLRPAGSTRRSRGLATLVRDQQSEPKEPV